MRSTATNRWILISVVGVLVVVGAGATIAAVVGDENAPGWVSPRADRIRNRRSRSAWWVTDGVGGGPRLDPLARRGRGVSAERLKVAFDASSGPSSYDIGSGELRIDGDLFAVFGISRLSDGTWAASSVEHCMRPPVG